MQPIEIAPIRVRVASSIRKEILAGRYAAGQKLSLTSVADQLGVSRTPVREAFQELSVEGLLKLQMNKEAIVQGIEEDDIRDHFSIRKLLEGEAVVRAIAQGMDALVLEKLQRLVAEDMDWPRYNFSFHSAIWKASGSKKLYALCETFWYGPSFSRSISDMDYRKESLAQHERIIADIKRKDSADGRTTMASHIDRNMQSILAGFAEGKTLRLDGKIT
jgi:DNA-binding GntR family transcriptional regulator